MIYISDYLVLHFSIRVEIYGYLLTCYPFKIVYEVLLRIHAVVPKQVITEIIDFIFFFPDTVIMPHRHPVPCTLTVPAYNGVAVIIIKRIVTSAHLHQHVLVSLSVDSRVTFYGVAIIRGHKPMLIFKIAMALLLPDCTLRKEDCGILLSGQLCRKKYCNSNRRTSFHIKMDYWLMNNLHDKVSLPLSARMT